MLFLFRCNKVGIAYGLITFHDSFIKEIVKYFEKGTQARRRTRQARKAINKAFKIAKKKKRKPGLMIDTAVGVIRGLNDEIEYTRKALRATYENMENALNQIEQERIEEPITLVKRAQELFEKKDLQKGLELLKESREKLNKKILVKTRSALFFGISGEVKDLKREIEKLKENDLLSSRRQHCVSGRW